MKSKGFPIILAVLLLVLIFQATNAQKEGQEMIDSLYAELPKLSNDTSMVNTLALLSLKLSENNLVKGIEVGEQAVKLAEDLGYNYGIAQAKLSLALNFYYQTRWEKVIKILLEAEPVFQKVGDGDRLCATYCYLTSAYSSMDIELARKYYEKAKPLLSQSKDQQWLLRNSARIHYLIRRFEKDSVYQFFTRYQKLLKSSGSELSLARSYLSRASYYEYTNIENDSATLLRELAKPILMKLNLKQYMAWNSLALGRLYRDKEKSNDPLPDGISQSEKNLRYSIALSKELGCYMFVYRAYTQLYLLYLERGDIVESLAAIEQERHYRYLWNKENDHIKMAAISYKYEMELKAKELDFVNAQNKQWLTIIYVVTAGMIMLLLILSLLLLIWRKNNQIKRQELNHQLVTLEQKALQSMMNPHFIFNALGSIQSYLLQNKSREAGLYLSQFARLIRQNLSAINSPMVVLEEEIDRLKNYLELEQLRMSDRFNYIIKIDENVPEDEVMIPTMILQPFVENAILHGISSLDNMGKIQILISKDSRAALTIVIQDNGIGMKITGAYSQRSEKHLNLGMEMTRKRLKVIGRKFHVETSIEISEMYPGASNPGTLVRIVVPIAYSGSKFN